MIYATVSTLDLLANTRSRDGDMAPEDEDMRVLTESTVACISQRHPLTPKPIPPSILPADLL